MRNSSGVSIATSLTAALVVLVFTAAAPAARSGTDSMGFDLSRHAIPPELIVSGGPPKDGIPAIDAPKFLAAEDAAFLRPDDRVVGIVIAGEARAYPLRILNWHELVNDEIGGRPIAVSYCPLTASAVVFDRRTRDEETVLSFGVSGLLYESNVLMYDRRTESLWSQLAGEAVTGQMMGTTLQTVPSELTTWEHWRTQHPETRVLSPKTGFAREYFRDPYASYAESDAVMFPPSRRDSRLAAKQLVLGVTVGRRHKAYPLDQLVLAGGKITDRLGEVQFEIEADRRTATLHVTKPSRTAEWIRTTRAYWFAWAVFHPDTALWRFRMPKGEGPSPTARDITVVEVNDYWSSITGPLVLEPENDPFSRGGLYVVSGTIKNNSGHPIHHVRLRFDLLDAEGRSVYREEGFNRAAEAMIELESPIPPAPGEIEAIVPIPPGGTDSYRMIFIGEEIPRFDHPRVTVLSASSE